VPKVFSLLPHRFATPLASQLSRVNQLFERYVTMLHEAADLVDEQTYPEPECVRSESSSSRKRALSHGLEEESAQRVRMIRMSNLERAGEKDPALPRSSVFDLMHELGFKLDEHTFEELFEEVDSRGDGTVTRSELITALGMACAVAHEHTPHPYSVGFG